MKLGESARLTIPGSLGYGSGVRCCMNMSRSQAMVVFLIQGFPAWGIPGDATLVFDIEITKITPKA
jgi:FKBP-type peptidyl-prolyl cis-trans isomerase